jgi:hypothetical protein
MHGRIRDFCPDHRIVIRSTRVVAPSSYAGDDPFKSEKRFPERLPIHQVNFRLAARKKQT